MARFFSQKKKVKAQEPRKTLVYYDFLVAFEHQECPICFLLEHKEIQSIRILFYENVNDLGLRQKLRRSGGFCPEHTRTFLKIGDKLGQAIIAADLVSDWIEHIDDFKEKAPCLLCVQRQETENRIISDFAQFIELEEFIQELQKSAGFCQSHFKMIFQKIANSTQRNHLIQLQTQKLNELLLRIKNFIQKNDYRFQHQPIEDEEIEAINRLWKFLKKHEPTGNRLE